MHGDRIVDIISHFAGYFEVIDEAARLRVEYDDFLVRRLSDNYSPDQSKPSDVKSELEGFPTTKVHIVVIDSAPVLYAVPAPDVPVPPMPNLFLARMALEEAALQRPFISQAAADGPGPHISVTYGVGADETAFNLIQNNWMVDNDTLGSNPALAELMGNTGNVLRDLAAQADEYLPDGVSYDTFTRAGSTEYLTERDAYTKAEGTPGPGGLEPGLYLNGVLQPEGTEVPVRPGSEEEDGEAVGSSSTSTGAQSIMEAWAENASQTAIYGGNTAFNGAVLIDGSLALGTLVVVGDSYRTDAIVQVNAYVDDDHIAVGSGFGGLIQSGGTLAHNAARFLETDAGVPNFAGSQVFAGLTWHVDIFSGDLYDINAVMQTNRLRDNDVGIQHTTQSQFELVMGANEQGNLSTFVAFPDSYDLMIVLGDYHSLNLIYQKNILVDPDIVKQYNAAYPEGGGANGEPAIATGNNWLMNNAVIENFGTNEVLPMEQSWFDLINALNSRESELDISYGMGIPNFNDPTFKVLIVTGSVWDINVIAQTNLIEDADVAAQFVPGDGYGPTPTQSVATGGNELTNFAAIVKIGPVAGHYVGGDFYDDDMLIQSEIIASDDDKITYGDPSKLASELVAFTTVEQPPADDEPAVNAIANDPNADLLGNMLT